ncbi:OmpA family protein [Collimonas humicola]|uniref:OmpA family protein n=1 Tax=Collimonas humicola TaxID=2825886 RepID=UPI001B8BF797|nr:OmpA family protein [Collimonas humicola]
MTTAGKNQFDINSVPMSTANLPPFPYFDWPSGLDVENNGDVQKSDFDKIYVIAGHQLLAVEGRLENRHFMNSDAKLTAIAAQRSYEAAIKAVGGVKISASTPDDPALVAQNGGDLGDLLSKKMRVAMSPRNYDYYLIRKPEGNIWIGLLTGDDFTQIITLAEKPLKNAVEFVKADEMQKELNAKGRVALYFNFDTDKASIRQDGQTIVDEITKLLNQEPALKLSIEGHTDNVGDPKHNQLLSQQRAQAVVAALTAKGIDTTRLRAEGYGASKPLADNASEEGRGKNRRVELVRQ